MAAGLIGVVVEVLIVRRFYSRPEDSLLATWGLSLIVTQGLLLTVGSSFPGVGTPPGSFSVGDYTFSTYRLVLFAVSLAALAFIYVVFMKTRFGVHARATMQNAARSPSGARETHASPHARCSSMRARASGSVIVSVQWAANSMARAASPSTSCGAAVSML